jgi:hypothetical protein
MIEEQLQLKWRFDTAAADEVLFTVGYVPKDFLKF